MRYRRTFGRAAYGAVSACPASLGIGSRSSSGLIAAGLWRRPCVVVQEARQEPDQLVAFGLGQWREQVVLDGGDQFVELSQVAAAVRGDGDDVAAAVGGIGGAFDEAAAGELVDDGDQIAAVDAGAAAQCRLARRAELLPRREHGVVPFAVVRAG